MTTGWIVVNIALAVIITLIVGIPAVLIPNMLDRGARIASAPATRGATRSTGGLVADTAERSDVAA